MMESQKQPSGSEPVLAHLILLDVKGVQQERFPIQSALTRMGRSMENDVRFLKNQVSRLHCTIQVVDGEAFLHVFGANGVTMNELQALPEPKGEGKYSLKTGDCITLAKKTFRFELNQAANSSVLPRQASPIKTAQTPAKRRVRMSLVNIAQIHTPSKDIRRSSLESRPLSPVKKIKLLPPMAQMDEEPADQEMQKEELFMLPPEQEDDDVVILEEVENEERQASTTPTSSPHRRKAEFLGRAGHLTGDFYSQEREQQEQEPVLVPLPRRPSRLSSPSKRRISLRTQTLLRTSAQYYDRIFVPPSPSVGLTKSTSMPSHLSVQDDETDQDQVDKSLCIEGSVLQPFQTPQPVRRKARGRASLPVRSKVIRISDVGLPPAETSCGIEVLFENAEEEDTEDEEEVLSIPVKEHLLLPAPEEKGNYPLKGKYGTLSSRISKDPLLSSLLKTPDMRHLRHVFAIQAVPDPPLGEIRNLFRPQAKDREVLDGEAMRELIKPPVKKGMVEFSVIGQGTQEVVRVLYGEEVSAEEAIQEPDLEPTVEAGTPEPEEEHLEPNLEEAPAKLTIEEATSEPVAEEESQPINSDLAPSQTIQEEPQITTKRGHPRRAKPFEPAKRNTTRAAVTRSKAKPDVEEKVEESPVKAKRGRKPAAKKLQEEEPTRSRSPVKSTRSRKAATKIKTDDEKEKEEELVKPTRGRKAAVKGAEKDDTASSPVKSTRRKAAVKEDDGTPASSPVKATRSRKAATQAESEPAPVKSTRSRKTAASSPIKPTRTRKVPAATSSPVRRTTRSRAKQA